MRIDEIQRYNLHCELILPKPGDPHYRDKDKINSFAPFDASKPAVSAAFLATQRAVENFKPWVTNADKPAIQQVQLGLDQQAHLAAFIATQLAVERFDIGEPVNAY